jgi:hypothetical protein
MATGVMALGLEPGGGLVIMPGAFMIAHRALIILAAARNKRASGLYEFRLCRGGGIASATT